MSKSKGEGKTVYNVPGGLYIIALRNRANEEAHGTVWCKFGISYSCLIGTMIRALVGQTYGPVPISEIAYIPFDEDMPLPDRGSKNGIWEVEKYIHEQLLWHGATQNKGGGQEWFNVPLPIFNMIFNISQGNPYSWRACPPIARFMVGAPEWKQIPAFNEEATRDRTYYTQQATKKMGGKISTDRPNPHSKKEKKVGRMPFEEEYDKSLPRDFDKNYMMNNNCFK